MPTCMLTTCTKTNTCRVQSSGIYHYCNVNRLFMSLLEFHCVQPLPYSMNGVVRQPSTEVAACSPCSVSKLVKPHGTLWYLDQGVPRECKKGEAVRLPQTQGSPPRPNIPSARAPPRGRPKQTPGRSGGSIPASTFRANRVVAPVPASCQPTPRPASPAAGPPGPSYAFVAGSDPVAAMDTSLPAPVGPAAAPVTAAAAAPSCTPIATPSVSPASSPAGPPAPTNPQ
ncbi:TPA: hypothetical protein ACH3X1_014387 [Trebouxia sp. C0004]